MLMRMRTSLLRAVGLVIVAVSVGCGASSTAAPAPSPAATRPSVSDAGTIADATALEPRVVDAAAPTDTGVPPAPAAKPAPVRRDGRVWPFHTWTRAEAVTFNQFAMRYGVSLLAYDDGGWSPHLGGRKPLDAAAARKALDLTKATEGDVAISKCPFPRHAVVLYDDEVPIASINVCFQCGDIVLWPSWKPEPDYSKFTPKQFKELEAVHAEQLVLYDKVFPKWQAFFRDEVGFPIDTKY
jgi:hypothetical protein